MGADREQHEIGRLGRVGWRKCEWGSGCQSSCSREQVLLFFGIAASGDERSRVVVPGRDHGPSVHRWMIWVGEADDQC